MISSTFALSCPHGELVGVRLADGAIDHPDLHPEEAERAAGLRGARRMGFVAGRIAAARALAAVGAPRAAIGSDARGAPVVPPGFVGSISHKNELGVALAARADGARIGVDVEALKELRDGVARLVLTEAERARLEGLDEGERARIVLASFSIKESIYKAIDPFVQRYVGYHEAIVELPARASMEAGFARASVSLALAKGESIARIEAYVTIRDGFFLSTARASTTGGGA